MAEDKPKDIEQPKEEGMKEEKPSKKVTTKKTTKKGSAKSSDKKKPAAKKSPKKAEVKVSEQASKPEPKKEIPKKKEDKPITFTEKKAKSSSGSGGKMMAFLVLIVLFALAAGALYQAQQAKTLQKDTADTIREDVSSEVSFLKEKLQNITAQLEEQRRQAEEEKKTDYVNADAGITFSYSTELGEVKEEALLSDEKENPQPVGLNLTFTSNPDVWITAVTPEYEAENPAVYTGGEEKLRNLCNDPLAIDEDGYCDFTTVMGQETIEQVLVLREDDRVTNVVKTVPLNINGRYTGLTLSVSLGLPPVSGRNLFAPTEAEDTEAAVDEFLRNIIKEDQLSLVTRQNLMAYQMILETLKQQ